MADYIDRAAALGSDSEDEEFDDETGEVIARERKPNGAGDDDSSEEEDDDDEEAAREVAKDFIVDEDDEDDERSRKREKRKRRRQEREASEERLEAEDLELIGELDAHDARDEQPRFKRLKQGHREERAAQQERTVQDIFSDDDDDVPAGDARDPRDLVGEFDDFIEEDELPEDERARMLEEREVARPGKRLFSGGATLPEGLSEAGYEDMKAAFGDGREYDWALELQENHELAEMTQDMDVQDVFEPAQVKAMMQTSEDREIQAIDVPERFQIARKPFKAVNLSPDEHEAREAEKAMWIWSMILAKKKTSLDRHLWEPLKVAIARVLSFINDDDFEIPFIFQNRKDYVIHASSPQDTGEQETRAERLLSQSDLWEVFEYDLKFRAMAERRDTLKAAYLQLKDSAGITDQVLEDWIADVVEIEEVQDLHDYLNFQYSPQLKDLAIGDAERNGVYKRAGSSRSVWDRIRASFAYNFVKAIGLSSNNFGLNLEGSARRQYTEDATDFPDDVADSFTDPPTYRTGAEVMRAAKAVLVEEICMNPRIRKWMRRMTYESAYFNCYRTDKGMRQITEDHKYYEFKYLRHQDMATVARHPELFLRMLKAEREGLVEVKLVYSDEKMLKEMLYKQIESDGLSDVAGAWNKLRRGLVDAAFPRLAAIVGKGVKEMIKVQCERELAKLCKDRYYEKLDQAPYKPKGMEPGTTPRVLVLSSGAGVPNRDAICWAYMEDDGRCLESGKFTDLRLGNPDKGIDDTPDVQELVELVRRRKADVIGVSGWSVQTRRLQKDISDIVDRFDLRGNEIDVGDDDEDAEDANQKTERLDVVMINDECARLYHDSDRAALEFPQYPPLVRYCIAIARYMQSPLLEYISLKQDIVSVNLDPNQDLLPQDKLMKALETATVDMVNVVGVEINDAVADPYKANMLPYVCGLGPRKAERMKRAIIENGGVVATRGELIGDEETDKVAACGVKVWSNCASFIYIDYDRDDPDSDYLDNTRVHPEDYELCRKIAADAMEMDEEDVRVEQEEGGLSGVVRRLEAEGQQDKVNDLVLEEYAEQLETNFKQRKRATLETIRVELQTPYEELRNGFMNMSTDEVFTMLTGETRDSLQEGMIVPVQVRRIFQDHMEVKLDCGIEGGVSMSEYPDGVGEGGIDPRQAYSQNQTLNAKLIFFSRKSMTAQLSLREQSLREPFKRQVLHSREEWDSEQERDDQKQATREKEQITGRSQRVIKHPNFRPFNTAQAEEYLGSLHRGDVVVRPSSKGTDHLAVTWKMSDNIYQHIDVLELEKENEFSVGKRLRIEGKYTYSDLDELIAAHVKGMAKKVDEMMQDDKFQSGSKAQTDQWLTTYAEANPKRSMYAFCINPNYPGYFYLCYKAGLNAKLGAWNVKVTPNSFELQKNSYSDMTNLKNGFKTLFMNMLSRTAENDGYRRR